MLVDTNLFIDLTRQHKPAQEAFKTVLSGQSTSVINKLELIVGTKSKIEMNKALKLLDILEIKVIPINEEISNVAEKLVKTYYHSHNMGTQDALVATTALVYNEELVTRDKKHFQFIPDLKLITPY